MQHNHVLVDVSDTRPLGLNYQTFEDQSLSRLTATTQISSKISLIVASGIGRTPCPTMSSVA